MKVILFVASAILFMGCQSAEVQQQEDGGERAIASVNHPPHSVLSRGCNEVFSDRRSQFFLECSNYVGRKKMRMDTFLVCKNQFKRQKKFFHACLQGMVGKTPSQARDRIAMSKQYRAGDDGWGMRFLQVISPLSDQALSGAYVRDSIRKCSQKRLGIRRQNCLGQIKVYGEGSQYDDSQYDNPYGGTESIEAAQ